MWGDVLELSVLLYKSAVNATFQLGSILSSIFCPLVLPYHGWRNTSVLFPAYSTNNLADQGKKEAKAIKGKRVLI
jgi:hypothetical protein